MLTDELQLAPLGKKTTYASTYQPDLLFPIARQTNRDQLGISHPLPFQGGDIWNAYEISWLNEKGKPIIALGKFIIPCDSPRIIESKSLKLYLNSFNHTAFDSQDSVHDTLTHDLSEAAGAPFVITLLSPKDALEKVTPHFTGTCLDELDIACDTYKTATHYLVTENETTTETLYSDLLYSKCLMTNQPDWASIQIIYSGKKIQHAGLLKYFISFRDCNEFAEQCVERIFMDISTHCQPEKLLVYARYTRRGGIDINPYRANYPVTVDNLRLSRQ